MEYKSLSKIFYSDHLNYDDIFYRRFNSESTIHFNFNINDNNDQLFCIITPEILKKVSDIASCNYKIINLINHLPGIAKHQFAMKCLIDELVVTNDIEGVNSTRRDITNVLNDIETSNEKKRFDGLVRKYAMLQKDDQLSIQSCKDIRSIYDDLVSCEVYEEDRNDVLDGEIFRKESVSVLSATQKEIHKGTYPESKIIDQLEQALYILNDESIAKLIRISIFHYLFGYIHPFYNGNGRVSRFISSYMLSKELNSLIGYRLSYTIKQNITDYYKAFEIGNNVNNRGDITPFVIMFTNIIKESMDQLFEALDKREKQFKIYVGKLEERMKGLKEEIINLGYLLIQAELFSENGISTKLLLSNTGISRTALNNRLAIYKENGLLIKRKIGREVLYGIKLEKL